jgi:hypothetical protein
MMFAGFSQTDAQVRKSVHAPVIEDPVFGTVYSPSLVKYEQVPSSLKKVCQGFSDPGEVTWLYSHHRQGNSEYFIVMSTFRNQDGDSFGSAIWIQGDKCQIDESKWVLSGVIPENGFSESPASESLPGLDSPVPSVCNSNPSAPCNYTLRSARQEQILRGLVNDAIQRAIKAYGGDAEFRKTACTPKVLENQVGFPIVQLELQAYCQNSQH